MQQPRQQNPFPDDFLTSIQHAVVQKDVIRIEYQSGTEENTTREVEPIGLFYYSASWHLIAWCRLRNGYRDFRADRIRSMKKTNERFDSRNLYSLKEYLATVVQSNREVEKVVVLIEKQMARYIGSTKYHYGFVSEEDAGDNKCRLTFLTSYLGPLCRWLMMYGNRVEIESPEKAREIINDVIEELVAHYQKDNVVS
jgi:predicted DNA-binding transcriptional regulator YafY